MIAFDTANKAFEIIVCYDKGWLASAYVAGVSDTQ